MRYTTRDYVSVIFPIKVKGSMIHSQMLTIKDKETTSTLGINLKTILQDFTNQCVNLLLRLEWNSFLDQVIKKMDYQKEENDARFQHIEMTLT